jgi:hypothetical protein
MMRRLPLELILAALVILVAAAWYGQAARRGAPPPGGLVGHTLGIVGFLLMLATEVLYTLRKRWPSFNVGSMNLWLRLHVFTGLVGPFLVLLHSAGKFNGLAGVVTWLTVLMVLSGFVGRYLYTAIPRALDGTELGAAELEGQIVRLEQYLKQKAGVDVGSETMSLGSSTAASGWGLVLGRHWLRWRQRRQVRQALRNLSATRPRAISRAETAEAERLLTERYRLWLELHSLGSSRRLLALWHLFHVPLGAVLFTLAFIHIGAALYYSTFLK